MLRVREQSRRAINGFAWIRLGAAGAIGLCWLLPARGDEVSSCGLRQQLGCWRAARL